MATTETKVTKTKVKDPVCGMEIDPSDAAGQSDYKGTTYFFCSDSCRQKFDAAPAEFVEVTAAVPVAQHAATNGTHRTHADAAAGGAIAATANGATSEVAANEAGSGDGAASDDAAGDSAANERCDLPLLGMHCASCASRIEKALNKAPGVEKASVNFATTRATVHYDPQQTSPAQLREAVKKVGYDAIVQDQTEIAGLTAEGAAHEGTSEDTTNAETQAREAEYKSQKQKFTIALALTIPVLFLAMAGHLSPALERALDFPGRAWVEMVLTAPVLFWAGREFFTGAWTAAKHRAADMNTLIAIGTFAAFAYSVVATVAPQVFASVNAAGSGLPGGSMGAGSQPMSGSMSGHAMGGVSTSGGAHAMTAVYYEVAASVVTLILMGRLLEARARARTSGAIQALMGLAPKTARVERGAVEQDIPIAQVVVGDIVLVRPKPVRSIVYTCEESYRLTLSPPLNVSLNSTMSVKTQI